MKEFIKSYLPFIARNLRKLINYMQWIKNKKNYKIKINHKYNLIELDEYKNTFFGYYDKTPFNSKNSNIIIFHANNYSSTKLPNPNIATDICMYNLKTKELKIIDTTYTWNWQQGARLHWLNEDEFIYNNINQNNELISKKFNIKALKYTEYKLPVQDSYDNYFISIDYSILNKIRPDYGYRNKTITKKNLYYYDIKKNTYKELVIITELIKKYIGDFTQEEIKGKINHVLISPDGKSFIFLFRYFLKKKRYHKLFKFNLETKKLTLLLDKSIISHYCWTDSKNIFFWGRIEDKSDYFILNTVTLDLVSKNTKLFDGHPNKINNNLILTDTYPDLSRIRKLMILDADNNKVDTIGEFFEPVSYVGETRCDLHPNISSDHKFIHCDTVFKNKRILCILEYKK